ncbi:GAF domain-containing protein [Pseudoroseomonas wenyumeiae]
MTRKYGPGPFLDRGRAAADARPLRHPGHAAGTDFDDIVRLAADLLEAPVAAVNLIGASRQWAKAEVGLGQREWPLSHSICLQAIHHPGGLVVPDIAGDARFASLPMAEGAPRLRFYAGIPLQTPRACRSAPSACWTPTRGRKG